MDIDNVKGIGEKTAKVLKNSGIKTKEDLISYYPFRYDIIKRSNIEELQENDKIIIDGIVESNASCFYFNKKMNKMSFKLNTGKYLMNITIFNRAFLKSKITPGTTITVIGKYSKLHNSITASDIYFKALPNIPVIEPVYHSIGSITSKDISVFIKNIESYDCIEYIPQYLKEKYKLIDKELALKYIHFPNNTLELRQAQAYLKYEELFLFMLKMNSLKLNNKSKLGLERVVDKEMVDEFITSLPFTLTLDQKTCVDKIYQELTSKKRMNRLIQGDVGSGKTVVAILALYINYLGGYQGALMAPTEVLAQQHFITLKNMFKNYNVNIEILTGKSKNKKEIIKKLQNKEIDILVGTHALFSDDVIYSNLGLVITDEQHRFGVAQRGNLKNKGITPDILYMSATPIPRTYALTIYGDMDISSIHTLPSGRKEIITYLKKTNEIKDVLNIIYQEIKNKHQIYVIAPLIEESDKIDLENVYKLEEQFTSAFGKICKIGIMHGKMDEKDKDKVMNEFKNGEISILISTTVIEVGVDVKNATVITIFDAYRFGLSQLHQLRGRVGRNDLQSYCILISDKEAERLNIMTKTLDGFKISEEDFKLRGSGDLFGVKQSGDMSFKIANLKENFNILLKAKEDTESIIENIDNYDNLKIYLRQFVNLD